MILPASKVGFSYQHPAESLERTLYKWSAVFYTLIGLESYYNNTC